LISSLKGRSISKAMMSTRGTITSEALRSWTFKTLPISTRSCAGDRAFLVLVAWRGDHRVDRLARVAGPPDQAQQVAQPTDRPEMLGLAVTTGRLGFRSSGVKSGFYLT